MSQNRSNRFQSGIKKMIEYFLQGLLYTAPLGLTVYVIYILFDFFDSRLQNLLLSIFGMKLPGVGILLMFLLIAFLGFIFPKLVTRPMILVFQKLISKAPAIEMVYSTIKEFISAFIGKDRKFTRPVLVKYGKDGDFEKIGFITEDDLSSLKIIDKVAVYIPYSYTFMGDLWIVPKSQITPIDLPAADVMKFVVSGGVTRF